MKKQYFLSILCVFFACLLFCSCGRHFSTNGLDKYYDGYNGISDCNITGDLLMTKGFMDKYPYLDGDFQYHWYAPYFLIWIGYIERSFAWLSYDAETYLQAKEAMLKDRWMESEQLDGKTAFGYTFYVNYAYSFADHFTAFGCNDETHTLVFIGIFVDCDSNDYEKCQLAETDLEAFLQYFYGEWYEWDSGSAANTQEETTEETTVETAEETAEETTEGMTAEEITV